MLNYTETLFFEVDYHDFNEFIEEEYGHPYSFAEDIESSNDTSHKYRISKRPLYDYEQTDLDRFRTAGKYNYLPSVFLTDLVNRGVLKEGTYLINVCW